MNDTPQTKIIEVAIKAFPYAEQISDIDFSTEKEVRLRWRGSQFQIRNDFHVNTVQGDFLHGDDLSIILEALLKRTYLELEAQSAKKVA